MAKKPLTLSITASGNKAQVKIIGEISGDANTCRDFAAQVEGMITAGVKDVDIYIFSGGGSCFEANEIVNIIKKFPGITNCKGGAIVASAASYIAVNCTSFAMPANGMLMIHKPEIDTNGNADVIESQLTLLKNLTEIYCKAYAKKTGKTEDAIKALWSSECWMGAQDAMNNKFCDSIITDESIDTGTIDSLIKEWPHATIPTALFNWANQIKDTNLKTESMKKVIKLFPDLTDDATEEIVAKKVGELIASNKVLQDKIDGFEKLRIDGLKAEAVVLIEAAVKDGRIDASSKAHFEKLFASDHETAKNTLASLKPHTKVADRLDQGEHKNDDLAKMSWDELDRGNKLIKLKAENPDLYKTKFKEKFGFEPVK